MASITVTNVSGGDVNIQDFYKTLAPGEAITTERSAADLPGMVSLQTALAAGTVTLAVTYSAIELSSGLAAAPQIVEARDMAPVAAAGLESGSIVIRVDVPVGGGGSDEVVIYAANALPFKFRVLETIFLISTGAGTWALSDEAGGGGQTIVAGDTSGTGRVVGTPDSDVTVVLTPGTLIGLFLARSDSASIGEIIMTVRAET